MQEVQFKMRGELYTRPKYAKQHAIDLLDVTVALGTEDHKAAGKQISV